MVTKLKDNYSYIQYIRKKMKDNLPEWIEDGETVYEDQVNNDFQINFKGNIQGYFESIYKISFVNDRGLLELRIFDNNDQLIPLGYLLYNQIIEKIPSRDSKWRTSLCVELVDFYIYFLRRYCIKN